MDVDVDGIEGDNMGRYVEGIGGFAMGVTISRWPPVTGRIPVTLVLALVLVAAGVLDMPVCVPGPISGMSKTYRCEAAKGKTEKGLLPLAFFDLVRFQLFSTWHVQSVHVGKIIERNEP